MIENIDKIINCLKNKENIDFKLINQLLLVKERFIGKTYKEIGKTYKISKQRVHQLIGKCPKGNIINEN